MVKRIVRYLIYGIIWGCTCFVFFNCIGAAVAGKEFLRPVLDHFLAQSLGYVLIGICCGSSAVVYSFKSLAAWMQICIHFVIGLTGYFVVACNLLKSIPRQNMGYCLVFILISVVIFTAIWSCFYLFNKWEAKKVNERLKELEKEHDV